MNELTLEEMLKIAGFPAGWDYERENLYRKIVKITMSKYLREDIHILVGYEKPIESPCEEKYYIEFRNRWGKDISVCKKYGDKVRPFFDKVHEDYESRINGRKQRIIAQIKKQLLENVE